MRVRARKWFLLAIALLLVAAVTYVLGVVDVAKRDDVRGLDNFARAYVAIFLISGLLAVVILVGVAVSVFVRRRGSLR